MKTSLAGRGAFILLVLFLSSAVSFGVGHAQRRRGPRVIQLDEIKIEGRVQKPNAFYILNRSNLGYEVLDLRTSFLLKVVKTIRSDPF